jgi:decaprenyl-phosphate phosphoribosyltransferase
MILIESIAFMSPGSAEAATPLRSAPRGFADRLRDHIAIARVDHWSKNVFILPGLLIPIATAPPGWSWGLFVRLVMGMLAVCLVASSNYVINEVLDAPFDRLHPIKKGRPVAAGLVSLPVAYVQWIGLGVAGMAIAYAISVQFLAVMAALWVMGCVYNIPPVRSKDVPYVDVLSESVNNPLRMLVGWYIVTTTLVPPISLLLSYWMAGCYFMALKRFSEYREINDHFRAVAYRKSFRYYTERSLLSSVTFYAAAAMLFFGAFLVRYRMELVLSFPLIAWVMAIYYNLSFEKHSAVQNPEHLYRQKGLMVAVVLCAGVMVALLFVDLPKVTELFRPTLPIGLR